ncbi:MAG: aldehyde dehydrogenase family protein [Vicingaceae bacterium]
MTKFANGNFINGEWYTEGDGSFLAVKHKYSGALIERIPQANHKQMDLAIQSAVKAFEVCRLWSAGQRLELLEKLREKLRENKSRMVDLIIAEAGKPRVYAETELERSLSTLQFAIEACKQFGGEVIPMDFANGEGRKAFTNRFPIGVVACITPFNFPLNLLMHKVAPALAVGCTLVVKPPPQAPLSAFALAEMMHEVGYPKGTINVLACDIPVAEQLVKDERPKMLSFTGSDQVGWHLKSICGKKKCVLELGGNAAVLVDDGVNVADTAEKVAKGAYLYAGQICISTQRIFVHQAIFEAFKKELIQSIRKLKVGDPNEPDCWVGPIIDDKAFNRLKDWMKEAKEGGAEVLFGGNVVDESKRLMEPTLFSKTKPEMKIRSEEAFGPLAVLEAVQSFEEGLSDVNNSRYGLQAGVFTNSLAHFKLAGDRLEVGGIIFNDIPGFRIDHMPYGGVKDSGMGKEGLKYSMREMTEERLIVY